MPIKLLNVDFLILPRVICEINTHHNRALENYPVDEQSADQTEPCIVALFAFKVDTDLVTIEVLI